MFLRSFVKIVLQNEDEDAQLLASSLQIKTSEIINLRPFHAIARVGNANHKIRLFKPPVTGAMFFPPSKQPAIADQISLDIAKKIDFLKDAWIKYDILKK